MKKTSYKKAKIRHVARNNNQWEQTESFNLTRPTSIRLSSTLVKNLKRLARLHGERSYQSLLKKWVSERVHYETELIGLSKRKPKVI
jgi:hypothetical protein